FVVLDRDLAFGVGAKPGELAAAADLALTANELVADHDRQGHQFGGFVAGVAEHHPLIAGALILVFSLIDAHGDVGGLAVNRLNEFRLVGVEEHFLPVVTDFGHGAARDGLIIDNAPRGYLAGEDDQVGRGQALAGNAAVGILLQQRVEDGVADLIAN